MPNHYEALQRAEQERRRKMLGSSDDASAASSTPMEGSDSPPARGKRSNFFIRMFRNGNGNHRYGNHRYSDYRLPETADSMNRRRVSLLQPDSYVAEQYRSLRGRIDSLASERPLKTLAVTSADPGEGKTFCAINLAVVTAMSVGQKVLLIDCDLRHPKIHRTLGLQPQVGLAEILQNQATSDEAIQQPDGSNLDVLSVRSIPDNPSELLASPAMRKLIEEVAGRYDRIILDTPGCLGLPDAKSISELCDGLVMVVRAGVTSQKDVTAALDILDRRRVVGMVLNGSEAVRELYGYYY
ncbi:MAG: CpsD/CapB family tyrosine-protein kinase [Myxococcota bacterium]